MTNSHHQLLIALMKIMYARDHNAEHGNYPAFPDGPSDDQGFDDWAADVAGTALLMYEAWLKRGGRMLRSFPFTLVEE